MRILSSEPRGQFGRSNRTSRDCSRSLAGICVRSSIQKGSIGRYSLRNPHTLVALSDPYFRTCRDIGG